MYVITGCPASGTGWASRVMTALGSPCGHESIFTSSGRKDRSDLEGDSSWLAAAGLEGRSIRLVRDPLDVVRSLLGTRGVRDRSYWSARFWERHLPETRGKDPLGTAIILAALWDTVVQNLPALDIDAADKDSVGWAFRYLTGRDTERDVGAVLSSVGKNTNSHRGGIRPLTWRDIENHPDGHLLLSRQASY